MKATEFKSVVYRRRVRLAPYVPGQHMNGVTIPRGVEPREGGMIARNEDSLLDLWYVPPEDIKYYQETV